MFSCPLLIKKTIFFKNKEGVHESKEVFEELEQIDYNTEWVNLKKKLNSMKVGLRVRKVCGTQDNLNQILKQGTMCLHYSGHADLENAFTQAEKDKEAKA